MKRAGGTFPWVGLFQRRRASTDASRAEAVVICGLVSQGAISSRSIARRRSAEQSEIGGGHRAKVSVPLEEHEALARGSSGAKRGASDEFRDLGAIPGGDCQSDVRAKGHLDVVDEVPPGVHCTGQGPGQLHRLGGVRGAGPVGRVSLSETQGDNQLVAVHPPDERGGRKNLAEVLDRTFEELCSDLIAECFSSVGDAVEPDHCHDEGWPSCRGMDPRREAHAIWKPCVRCRMTGDVGTLGSGKRR